MNLICASIWGTGQASSPTGHTLSGWDDCRAWAHSIYRARPNARKIVFTRNIPFTVREQFHKLNIETIDWQVRRPLHPSATRWEPVLDHLATNSYDWVICTDIRDCVYQADPFPWLCAHFKDGGTPIVLATESMPQHRCGDNYRWMEEYLGAGATEMRDKEVVCGGTIIGRGSVLHEFLQNIYAVMAAHPNPHLIDQCVLNHLAHTMWRDRVTIPRLSAGFILSGAWCWEPDILDPQPEIRNTIAYPRGDHNPFKIWHLYINRYWDQVRRLYWEKDPPRPYNFFRR